MKERTDMSKQLNVDNKSRAYWQNMVSEFRSGNLTQKAFCALNKIKFTTFHYWLYRKDLDPIREGNTPAFFPVKVDARTSHTAMEGGITISLQNGITISITKGVNIDTFRDLLEILK